MYKVFVNEKKLLLSKQSHGLEKNISFESSTTLEIAMDLVQNTSVKDINVYGDNIDEIWDQFKKMFRIIEAAGGIVYNEKDEILFIKRLGKWDLPKGKMEKGESREESAIREIEEETSLMNVQLQDFVSTTYHIYTERTGEKILKFTHWFDMYFEGENTAKPQIEEGITEVAWKNESQIESEVYANTFQNIKLILCESFEKKSK
jgi:ADP-ribose pyrophosphatase YjhB (NUDIX family)